MKNENPIKSLLAACENPVSMEESVAITRELLGTTLDFVADEVERCMRGELDIEEVLEMVKSLASSSKNPEGPVRSIH
jgi:hypothetical protein